METKLTQADAHELLDYSPDTGIFMWKKKRRGVRQNTVLGTDNGFGYLRITVLGTSYYAHRLAWLYQFGEWPKDEIDHINGNKSDNRISNLRSVTGSQNAQNKQKAAGVSWHKRAKKWQAHVCIYKKRRYLGLFESFDEAKKAYRNAKESMNVSL